jgi:hypothetical protein
MWRDEAKIPRSDQPSTGTMLEARSNGDCDGAE